MDVLCSLGGVQGSRSREVFKYGFPETHEDELLLEKLVGVSWEWAAVSWALEWLELLGWFCFFLSPDSSLYH